jgi:hypothetical protein
MRCPPALASTTRCLRKRSSRWAQKGIWQRLFVAVQEPDLDWVMLHSTVVRAHTQAVGSRKKPCRRRSPRSHPRRPKH